MSSFAVYSTVSSARQSSRVLHRCRSSASDTLLSISSSIVDQRRFVVPEMRQNQLKCVLFAMQHSHWSKRNAAVQIAMPRTSLTCVTSSKSLLLCCIWHCSDAICSRSLSFSFSLCLMSVVNRSDSFSSLCICASSIPGGMIRTVCFPKLGPFPKPKSCINFKHERVGGARASACDR